MGYMIDIRPIGTLLLAGYVIYDLIRYKKANLLRRVILYSFIFYLINVIHYTTGGIHIPPQEVFSGTISFQPVPFQFVVDWLQAYRLRGLDWFFWSSVRLTLFNLIMLFPLGVYLAVLFNLSNLKKALLILLSCSLFIEFYQLIFSYLGLVFPRTFNVDDLLLNTIGGFAAFYLSTLIIRRRLSSQEKPQLGVLQKNEH